jgi:hypothetical protein
MKVENCPKCGGTHWGQYVCPFTEEQIMRQSPFWECTKETPWKPEEWKGRVSHPDAHEVGEQENGYPGGDIVTYECPNCKHRWRAELPQ